VFPMICAMSTWPATASSIGLVSGSRFFESYISDLVDHDVRQLTGIERPADMRRLTPPDAQLSIMTWRTSHWNGYAGPLVFGQAMVRRCYEAPTRASSAA
jgi:hypothetical protein